MACNGVYSYIGISSDAKVFSITPLASATFMAVLELLLKYKSSIEAASILYLEITSLKSSSIFLSLLGKSLLGSVDIHPYSNALYLFFEKFNN